jgi:IS1 family transposase
MFQNLQVSQVQLDELWAFIGKKQRRLTPEDSPERGDCFTFLATDALGKAILAYHAGKRDGASARAFLTDLRARVLNAPIMSSDAFPAYEDLVREIFGQRVHYGQITKRYVGEPHKDAARRYSPGTVVGVEREALVGFPLRFLIGTSHIERTNLTVRMSQRRFTRLTNAYSKKFDNHAAAVALFVGHFNFCRVHETLRVTPAMELAVTDHVRTIAELIEAAHAASKQQTPGRQACRLGPVSRHDWSRSSSAYHDRCLDRDPRSSHSDRGED